ncbi:TonB-dependent receptor domain-containing protein, partial [Shinella sp. BYT-45]|uniref:TonB-dependent receptor domain-containing protein n=1 Tax=Shinella sp. BYT-45 TaxID=3377377 RepID=UPI00397FAAC0
LSMNQTNPLRGILASLHAAIRPHRLAMRFSAARRTMTLPQTAIQPLGEATVPIVGGLKATVGLRATKETKDITYRFTGNGTPGTLPSYYQHADLDDTFLTGRAALSYDWNDDIMTYVSVGRGAVAGGMPWTSTGAALGRDMPSYPTSTSWTYEAGFKSTLLDGRMTLNGSVFFNDVKNGHLLVVDPATFAFSTAALDYETYGAELEARFEVTPGFNVFGGLGYTHAELKNVPVGSLTGASSGNTVPNVPNWAANIGAEYRFAASDIGISQGEIVATAMYQFVGTRQADVANHFSLDSYGIVNARIGWEGEKASVYAFGTNLFDERYEAVGNYYGPTALTVRPGPGRIIGVGASVKF